MEIEQILIMIISNGAIIVPLFLWNRAESRNDNRNMDQKIETIRFETNTILEAIRQDIKDFHGRLCAIEEKNKTQKKG